MESSTKGAEGFDNSTIAGRDTQTVRAGSILPEKIERFQILRLLGQGGMGEVFEAEQTEPVHRKVALKIIKRGMDTKEVLARFDSERQALAIMNHPNIARMLDGGVTAQGLPYFVMDYIEGVPITEYCDSQSLSNSERLELFVQVCAGVQHAHQKGIIHRDIKPSNVLVTVEDQKVIPKIIDFGLAKALGSGEADMTQFTHAGQVIGTPDYMSPEQVSGSDIDTRTDVYSLGVLLYQLLVGMVPFGLKNMPDGGWNAFQRRVCEQEPVRPSVRISHLGQDSIQPAQKRRVDSASWIKELHGDLDWITLRALEKDRTRRYQSPSELAADITRHLKNEPILASPPSTAYRVRKFVRRHRIGVAAAAIVGLALVAGITGTTIGLIRATRAERAAVEEAENTRQVSDFLVGLFKVSDPSEARGNSIKAREILDKGADKVTRELRGQPLVQGKMMYTMGLVYRNLGLFDQAQLLLEKALATRTKALGPNHADVGNTLILLGNIAADKGDFAKARDLTLKAMAIEEKAAGPESEEVASCIHNLGTISWIKADYPEARRLLEQSLAIRKKVLGPKHELVATTLEVLGAIAFREGNMKKALEIWEQTLAIREDVLGRDHPLIAYSLNNLALAHFYGGDPKGAVPLWERTIQIQEKVLGPNHPDLASGLSNLGDAVQRAGDRARAKTYYERAVAIMEAANPGNPELGRFLINLAGVLLEEKDLNGAEKLYRRSLDLRIKALGPNHPDLSQSLGGLAYCAAQRGRIQEAESLYQKSLALARKPDGSYYRIVYLVLKSYEAFLRSTKKDARAAEIASEVAKLEGK